MFRHFRDDAGKLGGLKPHERFDPARAYSLLSGIKTAARLCGQSPVNLRASPLARLRTWRPRQIGEAAPQQHREEIARDIAELDGLGRRFSAGRLDAGAAGTSPHQRIDALGLLAEECAPFDMDHAIVLASPYSSKAMRRLAPVVPQSTRKRAASRRRRAYRGFGGMARQPSRGHGLRPWPGHPRRLTRSHFRALLPPARPRWHVGGTGLGLSLVRQIAARHGGKVECLPRDGGGACFEVMLPPSLPAGP